MPSISDLKNREPVPALPESRERGRLRRAFGITQAQLAKTLGVSRQTVIGWERGRMPNGNVRNEYAAILAAWSETERLSHGG